MWEKNKLSWKEKLFTEIPFNRFQELDVNKWDSPIAVYKKRHNSKGNEWPNLKLEGLLTENSAPIKAIELIFGPAYYLVGIDTRKKWIRGIETSIESKDGISGELSFNLEYQAYNLDRLLGYQDPLGSFVEIIKESARERAYTKLFQDLQSSTIKNVLVSTDDIDEIGIRLHNIADVSITWPEEITLLLVKPIIDSMKVNVEEQQISNKISKLKKFGVKDPYLQAIAISKDDNDFQTIIDHVANITRDVRGQQEKDIELLKWLIQNDHLSGPDIREAIQPLFDRIKEHNTTIDIRTSMLVASSSSPRSSTKKLSNGETRDDSDNEVVITKKSVNFDEPEDGS